MPAFGKNALVEIARRMKTLLPHVAGVRSKLGGSAEPSDPAGVNPENVIWLFGMGRSGSTWLVRMMEEFEGNTVWFEPQVGSLFDPIRLKTRRREGGKHFILGEHYKEAWSPLIRRFVLDGARARFPEVARAEYVIIKELGASASAAPYLMEAIPESRMLVLVRDPRDVAASWVDAHERGDWVFEGWRGGVSPYKRRDSSLNNLVNSTAIKYQRNLNNVVEAYESHRGYRALVRYEDLRADTTGIMKRIYSDLGVSVEEDELSRVVKKHAFENIPQEEKGQGKFYRKGEPGRWRQDLTPEQIAIVEERTAPIMKRLNYEASNEA